jgi:hypothetical protein
MRTQQTKRNDKKKSTSERIKLLEVKAKRAAKVAKELRKKTTDLEEWAENLVNELKIYGEQLGSILDRLESADHNLFQILDRIVPDEGPGGPSIRTGLEVLIERGGAAPIDGNAVDILRRLPRPTK